MGARCTWAGIGALALLAGVPGVARAQHAAAAAPAQEQARWRPPFIQRPGVREFTGRIIASPRPGIAAEVRAALTPFNAAPADEIEQYTVVVPPGYDENTLAEELLRTGLFLWVRPDWLLFPTALSSLTPDDPWFNGEWNLNRIHAPEAWNISPTTNGVTVAFVDTGADFTHPDLAPNMVLGYCSFFPSRRAQTIGPPWNNIVLDSNGHGTAIAGVMGAVGNNALGMSGVAWGIGLMPIRASGTLNGAASYGDLRDGALWASAHGAKVISISYTGVEDVGAEDLGSALRARNCLLVWAMSDDNWNMDQVYPFDHPSVTVVGGTDPLDQRWLSLANPPYGSSYGRGVDIAAPAAVISVTTIGGGYGIAEGNSFAGPHVAAALALVWGLAPGMPAREVELLLFTSADDVGPPGEDVYFGVGRLNLRRALWATVMHQRFINQPTGNFNSAALGMDDVYDFMQRPMDITLNGVIDAGDVQAVSSAMRRDERADLVAKRP